MSKLKNKYPSYFYNPAYDTTVSTAYDYIYYYDENSNSYYSLYFIQKSGLPNDIKEQIKGGDAIDEFGHSEKYAGYSSFKDCYLVSQNLKVTYLDGSLDGAKDLSVDTEGGLKTAFEPGDDWAKLITGNSTTKVTMQDTISKTELTISGNEVSNLLKINNFANLTKLTLVNYTGSLEGLGNAKKLTYLMIDNSGGTTSINYSGIEGATELRELYFYMPTNDEVDHLCTSMSGTDYEYLNTLGFYGGGSRERSRWVSSLVDCHEYYGDNSNLSNISYLDDLTPNTKNKILTVYLHCNSLTSLVGLNNFNNLWNIYASSNQINSSLIELKNLKEVRNLYLARNNLTDDSLLNIGNLTNLVNLNCYGSSAVTNIDVIKTLTNIDGLVFLGNTSIVLNDENTVKKIAGLSVKQFDSKYANDISLVAIGSTVQLNRSATNDHLEKLRGKSVVEILDIGGASSISNDKLISVLPTLTNLKILYARDTNLSSLTWITSNNQKLKVISIYGCPISSLAGLENCVNLTSLQISSNISNLRPYSTLINNMCSRDEHYGLLTASYGYWSYGGIDAPASVLNTLNGSTSNVNTDFKCFNRYSAGSFSDLVDFTFTGLKSFGTCYFAGTVRVPACFESIDTSEIANTIIDVKNVQTISRVVTRKLNKPFVNTSSFNGVKYVEVANFTDSSVASLIGSATKTLSLGRAKPKGDGGATYAENSIPTDVLCSKGTAIEYLVIYKNTNIVRLNEIQTLNCNEIVFGLSNLEKIDFSKNCNLVQSLTTLNLASNKIASLTGLKYATNLKTLDLSNNLLQNTVSFVEDDPTSPKYNQTVSMPTCEYLALLPNLTEVKLAGNSITNVQGLLDAGFTQNGMTFTRTLPESTGTGGANE